MSGLYVHIPFCASRCIYCGFYSTTRHSLQHDYVDALLCELNQRASLVPSPFTTIYFGGGTPSVLPLSLLQKLVDGISHHVDANAVKEWTMECNPDDVTPELALWLGSSPINRVSMGVQTFDDKRLRWLHRRHDSTMVERAVKLLRDNGITNISLDLMFGFPGQTISDWRTDLKRMLAIRPQHISAYSLMYEENTMLMKMYDDGMVEPISEEVSREMYYTLVDTLVEAGYEHYEISNFALIDDISSSKSTYRSQHNSSYWHQVPYLGIGAAAHSYNMERRWWNKSNIEAYIASPATVLDDENSETIDSVTRYNDIITTALRTSEGVSFSTLSDCQKQYLVQQSEPHVQRKTMKMDECGISLTREGLYVSDDIMSDLILLSEDDK